jgi:hypothetical protein
VLADHSTHNAVIRRLVDSVAGPNASVHISMPMGVHFVAVIFYLPQEIHDHYDTKHRTLGCTTRRYSLLFSVIRAAFYILRSSQNEQRARPASRRPSGVFSVSSLSCL